MTELLLSWLSTSNAAEVCTTKGEETPWSAVTSILGSRDSEE